MEFQSKARQMVPGREEEMGSLERKHRVFEKLSVKQKIPSLSWAEYSKHPLLSASLHQHTRGIFSMS